MAYVQPYGATDLWQLPQRLRTLVEAELESGETVAWFGQPSGKRSAVKSLPIVAFGIPWTAFALFWTAATAGFKLPAFQNWFELFPLFGVPFILIGLGMLSAPLLSLRNATKTVYVLTDRRAIIFEGGRWSTTIRSLRPDQLGDLQRKQFRDGSGDLIFERTLVAGNKRSNDRLTEVGFMSIPNVQDVEQMARKLAETKTTHED